VKRAPKTIPLEEEFLSLVRYIILDEERDMYKEYPPSEREEFIGQFWARRDPRPSTIKNEFKEKYLQSIEEANKLFRGVKGWLQDRGRIYILFGYPDNMGGIPIGLYGCDKPTVIWTYHRIHTFNFSPAANICFIDHYRTGDYRIASNIYLPDFTDRYNPFGANILPESTINDIAEQFKHDLLSQNPIFNFQWKFIKGQTREKKINLTIHMEMPYDRIIFHQGDDQLVADMELMIEIRDSNQILLWDYNELFYLNTPHSELESIENRILVLDIPVSQQIPKGRHTVFIHLLNVAEGQVVKKLLKLNM